METATTKQKIMTTHLVEQEFLILLRGFNELVAKMPPVDSIRAELIDIQESADRSSELTIRQKSAISDRVQNYLKGDYGNTKTEEHYGHGKPEKK